MLVAHIAQVVVYCAEVQAKTVFRIRFLVLLSCVVLESHDGFDVAAFKFNVCFGNGFVVIHLLKRKTVFVGSRIFIVRKQIARKAVALAFHYTGIYVVITDFEVGIPPIFHQSQLKTQGPFVELRVGHIAVVAVAVGVGEFVAIARVP